MKTTTTTTIPTTIPTTIITTIFALFAALILIVGCAPITPGGDNSGRTGTGGSSTGTYVAPFDPTVSLEPQRFTNEEQLLAFIRANAGSGGYYRGGEMMLMDAAMVKSSDVATTPTAAMEGGSAGSRAEYSQTNNQVAGVDEADIIKTDGEYIYTVTGTTIFIVKAYPGEDADVVSTITLTSAPQGLFLDGDRLAVLGNFYDQEYFKNLDFIPRQGMTFLTIYDVSDKEDPEVIKEYKYEGSYQQARMADGEIYIIVQSQPVYRDHPTPLYIDGTVVKNVPLDSVRYFPIPYDTTQFTTVHRVAIDHPDETDSVTLTTTWTNTIYMSDKNIYLASTENINEWEIRQEITMRLLEPKISTREQLLIDRIKAADDELLSQQEKKLKIWQVYSDYQSYRMDEEERRELQDQVERETKEEMQKYDALTYTVINKVSLPTLAVQANGRVPGTVNNQFSMDEYDNVLRVATTLSQNGWWRDPMLVESGTDSIGSDVAIMPRRWNWQTTNNIYTLDSDLDVLDTLEGLAEGETIQSARFMADRLYLVTFRQTDPFFVIDLSDPANIRKLGQLKIPGFSRYLHPYDENTIIGIGQDATETGRQRGLKISLFDVSNVEHPEEVAKFVAEGEYSSSTAEYEHKAFLFDKEKELLVIPAYANSYDGSGGKTSYNGAMVFQITKRHITLRGIIDHSDGNQNWGAMVERSLWIEDLLYTKSPHLLRINKIDDLNSVKKITLREGSSGPYPLY